jgi:Ser/Thr protein kinase RdoA (MazF antagonist)
VADELTNDEIRSILGCYAVGDLTGIASLPLDSYNMPAYRVETTTGRHFLKRYKCFTVNVDGGLDLIVFLRRRGYPAIEVLLSREGSPHVAHGGAEVALFEYVELPDVDWALPPSRAHALGEALGAFHALAQDFPLPEVTLGHDELLRRLRAVQLMPGTSDAARETLTFVADTFPSLTVPAGQPRGACHVDFELDHVRFSGDTIIRVIDWDLVGADYLWSDLATTMSETVHADGVDFSSLVALVAGYQTRRALTDWERTHLYEATTYGTCKYLIWEYRPQRSDADELADDSFKKVDALRAMGKQEFDARYELAASGE